MNLKLWMPILAFAGLLANTQAGEVPVSSGYKVLDPIRHGNLTVFPVVAAVSHNTQAFLTLDEGIRSGEVIVTESGNLRGLQRGRDFPINRGGDAQVNQLVLVNNSKRPLILLAGEIVTGGKQDRVIGKDRIVPAGSDPIDLGVFCVEPGRWTASSTKFGSLGYAMAQPTVRAKAMAAKDQQQVWSAVRQQQAEMSSNLAVSAGRESSQGTGAGSLGSTTSYARVMGDEAVQKQVDAVAEPIERGYQNVIQQLRDHNAVGVVVAVNGEIVWADIFASTDLLEKYWPKLVRSYAAEAIVKKTGETQASVNSAQQFLNNMQGQREVMESEPGLYRHTEVTGDGFKVFQLTSLLPKTGFDLHLAKMTQ